MIMEQQKTLVHVIKFSRIQSPSSINTFRQCPRKYYYQYIQRLPTTSSIHLVRGNIVHGALEEFFSLDLAPAVNDGFALKTILLEFFKNNWRSKEKEISKFKLSEEAIKFYYEESISMLEVWFDNFNTKLSILARTHGINQAFKMLTPRVEEEYLSTKLGVRGFIDAIHEFNDKTTILDYKTSSKDTVTPEYRLQLAIYALLYLEKHNKLPDNLVINFLKFGEKFIEVNDELIELAKNEIKNVHEKTITMSINDYPKNITPLCKWSNGQCDFYDTCFK